MAKSENLLKRAIRKENQMLFDRELLKRGRREAQAVRAKEITSPQADAALKGFPEH